MAARRDIMTEVTRKKQTRAERALLLFFGGLDTRFVQNVKMSFDLLPSITIPFKIIDHDIRECNVLSYKPCKELKSLIRNLENLHFLSALGSGSLLGCFFYNIRAL